MTTDVLASELPRVHVGDWFSDLVDWCTTNLGWLFDGIGSAITWAVDNLTDLLNLLPPAWVVELEGRGVILQLADDFVMEMTQAAALHGAGGSSTAWLERYPCA